MMFHMSKRYGKFLVALMLLLAAAGVRTLPSSQQGSSAAAFDRITNEQFARYIEEWSEPEGYFDTDNFVSNETSYLHVTDDLHKLVKPGNVYIGVGPDQNFSYIVHTKPAFAVIVDIRRQNMLQHLLFKAIFSKATDRAGYLTLLFSKPLISVSADTPIHDLLQAVRRSIGTEELFRKNLAAIQNILRSDYKLRLTDEDLSKIEYVYSAFYKDHLDLRFSTLGRAASVRYPSFEELLLETDRQGRHQSFLASEDSFRWLKRFQEENRLVPIVGDFAGSHAIRSTGAFLRQNGLRVAAFYASNVEFYLFGQPSWAAYLANLHTLPMDAESVMIRAYFPTYGRPHPMNVQGHRPTSLVHPMQRFVSDYDAGRVQTYWDVVNR